MSSTNPDERDPKAPASTEPLTNEPAQERTAEEKQGQEQQAAEIAKPKPSGAV